MNQNISLPHSALGNPRSAARLAILLACSFEGILILLHFLEPEFDPTWRMISEYEIGRYGWMMRLAFFGSIIVSNIINPSAGRVGPEVFLGLPNRLMVSAYCLWIIIVGHHASSLSEKKVVETP